MNRPPATSAPFGGSRLLLRLTLAATFVAGLGCGAALHAWWNHDRFMEVFRHREDMPNRILGILKYELSLDAEQTSRVESLVREHHAEMESLRAEIHPRFQETMQRFEGRIDAVLTPTQQLAWKRLTEQWKQRLPPPPGPPGKHHHGPPGLFGPGPRPKPEPKPQTGVPTESPPTATPQPSVP